LCYNVVIMSSNSPQLLKGFRDFGPDKMSARLVMLEKIRKSFERFGFAPMETPVLEYEKTLTGKYGAEEKLMYRFSDQGGRAVAMRYDLTVPLARFYTTNKETLPKPFKRYAIGPVWRAENTQKGRFREFYQCDVDVVGSSSAIADAESIAAIYAALKDLGLQSVTIRINNRKIIQGILEVIGVDGKKTVSVLRFLDKIDKQGEGKVKKLLEQDGMSSGQVKDLFDYLQLSASESKGLQDNFSRLMLENKNLAEGIGELSDVLDALYGMGVTTYTVDLKLARGLDYYTGTVCEMVLSELPNFGSIAGGGRYNNLIGTVSGGKEKIPAVGMSIGIDRLIVALEDLDLIKYDSTQDVLVFNLDEDKLGTYLGIVTGLRRGGVNADLYYKTDSIDKQFKYADSKKINLAVIIGEDEIKKGIVTIKNLATRKQWSVKSNKLLEEIKKSL